MLLFATLAKLAKRVKATDPQGWGQLTEKVLGINRNKPAGVTGVAVGKLDQRLGASHHVAHHLADVASCFEAIVSLPVIREQLEMSVQQMISEHDIARFTVLAFVHHAGKLHS